MKAGPKQKKEGLSNHEIVAIALYLLGGAKEYIDTEDIAKRANELAPGRFTWKKYHDQINLELIRVFLSDAKKEKNGALVTGSGKDGWMLTTVGSTKAKSLNTKSKSVNLTRDSRSPAYREWLDNERQRLLNSTAFDLASSNGAESISHRDIEAFFRLNDYITGDARAKKISRVVKAFGDDELLGSVVKKLAELISRGK